MPFLVEEPLVSDLYSTRVLSVLILSNEEYCLLQRLRLRLLASP